jgi:hypothetical protein
MSIRPPSDIVLDVARAADPTQYAEASRRLGRTGPVDALAFDAVLDRTGFGSRPRHLTDGAGELSVRRTNAALLAGNDNVATGRKDDVYSRFEAMALTAFVESMLPATGDAVFGAGNSGRIWKGMLAEKIAAQMAEAGGIGIAEQMRTAAALRDGGAAPPSMAALGSVPDASPVGLDAGTLADVGAFDGEPA